MAWLDEVLTRAKEAVRKLFSGSPAGCASQPCAATSRKILRSIPRVGTGAFKRDSSGAIKAVKTGGPFVSGHGGAPGEQFVLDEYELDLADGSTIKAYKSQGRLDQTTKTIVHDSRMDTDCHGVTFTNGDYWINNDEVDKILVGGGFKKTDRPKPGDILVYRDGNNEVVHSVTVTDVDMSGQVSEVSGLGGIEMKEHQDPPQEAWYDQNATRETWSK